MVDRDFVRQAVAFADPNVLRVVLFQLTGEAKYTEMALGTTAGRGGAYQLVTLSEQDAAVVRADTEEYILSGRYREAASPPDREARRELLALFTGEQFDDQQLAYRRGELRFEEFPFFWKWEQRPRQADDYLVAVVGAGVSGIAMAVQLEQLGLPYVVLERRNELGGTWSINHYPDARVDTMSFLYQYTFEKRYPWTEFYARQGEVRSYLEHIARNYGVFGKIRFGCGVVSGEYQEDAGTWALTVRAESGEETRLVANFVVSASGLFSSPREIPFPGAEDFEGHVFHSTAWPPDVDIAGKRVAIVGNGSTGVQMLSKIAKDAEQVHVFQRTPQWIAPSEQYGAPIPAPLMWLLEHFPFYWNWYCYARLVPYLSMAESQRIDSSWQDAGGGVSERNDTVRQNLEIYIAEQLEGRTDLIERVTPDYPPLARRMILDNGWYRALLRPNVELVTTGIDRLEPTGIVTTDGAHHPVDTIVAAIGFSTTRYVWPAAYSGRAGKTLEEVWADRGPRAYLGICVPELPNFFMMYGPNSQTRASGFIAFVEQWAAYISKLIASVIEAGSRSVEVREDAYLDYSERVDKASEEIVWRLVSSERNYYLNEFGRQHVSAPWLADDYYAMLRDPNRNDFTVR